jgi:hydroxypyruvate isomerase
MFRTKKTRRFGTCWLTTRNRSDHSTEDVRNMKTRPLAVNAEMVFLDLPFYERVERLKQLGFRVGLWGLDHLDVDRLAAIGADYSMVDGFGEGNIAFAEPAEALVASVEDMIPMVKAIGRPFMNLHGTKLSSAGPALNPVHVTTGDMWMVARQTLTRIAELGERHDLIFTVENLNPVDHPGVPFAHPVDILALMRAVNSPRVRMNLDLYHAQKDGGNLIALLKECQAFVAEVQIADVPLRDAPGGGEIHYPNVAAAMKRLGYDCSVGLEAFAPGDSTAALARYRSIFSHFHKPEREEVR